MLQPFIFTPNEIPLVFDVDVARASPALAVLSAICHGGHGAVEALFPALTEALRSLGPEKAILYYDIVLVGLPVEVRTRWEAFMTATVGHRYQSELLRNLAAQQPRTLLGQGREAEVFGLPDGSVLKLMRDADRREAMEREIAALAAVAGVGLVPRVRGHVDVDGRPGILLDRVDGPDLLTYVGSRPWLLRRAGRVLASVHTRLHDQVAPDGLPDLHSELTYRIQTAPGLPPDLASWALTVLNGLPTGDRICHGDFHLANILGGLSRPVVIDWGAAARGDPVADVANTWLVHRMGRPPPGTPLYVRMVIPAARGIVVSTYMRGYRRGHPVDRDRFRRWQIVRVAARFHARIAEEVDILTAWLRARYPK